MTWYLEDRGWASAVGVEVAASDEGASVGSVDGYD